MKTEFTSKNLLNGERLLKLYKTSFFVIFLLMATTTYGHAIKEKAQEPFTVSRSINLCGCYWSINLSVTSETKTISVAPLFNCSREEIKQQCMCSQNEAIIARLTSEKKEKDKLLATITKSDSTSSAKKDSLNKLIANLEEEITSEQKKSTYSQPASCEIKQFDINSTTDFLFKEFRCSKTVCDSVTIITELKGALAGIQKELKDKLQSDEAQLKVSADPNKDPVLIYEQNVLVLKNIYLLQLFKLGKYYQFRVSDDGPVATELKEDSSKMKELGQSIEEVKKINDSITSLSGKPIPESEKDKRTQDSLMAMNKLDSLNELFASTQPQVKSLVTLQQSIISTLFFDAASIIHTKSTEEKLKPLFDDLSQTFYTNAMLVLTDDQPIAGTMCINREVPFEDAPPGFRNKLKINTETKLIRLLKQISIVDDTLTHRGMRSQNFNYTKQTIERVIGDKLPFNGFHGSYSYYDLIYNKNISYAEKKYLLNELSSGRLLFKKSCDHFFTWIFRPNVNFVRQINKYNVLFDRDILLLDSVQIEFYEGSILNVMVRGRSANFPNTRLTFYNRNIPFQFSSTIHYDNSNRYYPLQAECIRDGRIGSTVINYFNMNLFDAIDYWPNFSTNRMNYCPGDTTITLSGLSNKDAAACVLLRKEKTQHLFDFRIYTDPIGLSGDDENGLLQAEISKKVVVRPRSTKVNMLTYIEPKFVLSRIEKADSLLERTIVRVNDKDTPITVSKLNMIELLHKSKLNYGLGVNLITTGSAGVGMIHYLNVGANIFQTKIQDSLYTTVTSYDSTMVETDSIAHDSTAVVTKKSTTSATSKTTLINSANLYVEYLCSIRPDERYGFQLGLRFGRLAPLTSGVNANEKTYSRFFNYFQASLEAFLSLSKADKFFFRGIYTSEIQSTKQSPYLQLHIGYSRCLLNTVNALKRKK